MIITLVFVVSRVLVYGLGVTFYTSFIHRLWQAIDVNLLSENLWQSLYYSHAQPPLFNLLTGVLIKVFGTYYGQVFQLLNLVLSGSTSVLLYLTLSRLNVHRSIRWIATLYFMLSPSVILYENLFSYTIIVMFLLALLTYLLICFLNEKSFRRWICFAIIAALLVLTRSTFHLAWLMLTLTIVLYLVRRDIPLKKFFVAGFIIVLLSSIWFFKNWLLFDSFSSSSWLGMSMARIMPPDSELGRVGPFRALEEYKYYRAYDSAYCDIPLLHEERKQKSGYINFYHIDYVHLSKDFLKQVMEKIKENPRLYLGQVRRAFIVYFNPVTTAPFIDKNYSKLQPFAGIYSLDFSPQKKFSKESLTSTAAIPAFFLYLSVLAVSIFVWKKELFSNTEKSFVAVLLFIQTYGMLVGNLFEYGENNRFRLETVTIVLLLACLSLSRLYQFYKTAQPDLKD